MEEAFLKVAIMLVPGLMAITCHEVAHGFVADRLGDDTARSMGRLTLNPLKHLDIIGTIMIFLINIGWAKPVPVNFGRLRHPRRDMILVAAAGPITNFALAFLSAMALRALGWADAALSDDSPLLTFLTPTTLMLGFSVYINLVLGIFNLIPVPPLDGGRVAVGLLPFRLSMALASVERYGFIIIIALVYFTDIFRYILPLVSFAVRLIAGDQAHLIMRIMTM